MFCSRDKTIWSAPSMCRMSTWTYISLFWIIPRAWRRLSQTDYSSKAKIHGKCLKAYVVSQTKHTTTQDLRQHLRLLSFQCCITQRRSWFVVVHNNIIYFVLHGFIIHIVLHALMEKENEEGTHIEVMVNIANVARSNMTITTVTKFDSQKHVIGCICNAICDHIWIQIMILISTVFYWANNIIIKSEHYDDFLLLEKKQNNMKSSFCLSKK